MKRRRRKPTEYPDPWPDRKGPKYVGLDEQLENLVQEFGLERVRGALAEFAEPRSPKPPRRTRGRPPRSDIDLIEDMHLADWFYSTVEDYYRQAGNKKPEKPVQQAETDLYNLTCEKLKADERALFKQWAGGREIEPDSRASELYKAPDQEKWAKSIKEKRLRGLNAWRALARKIRERPDLAKAHGRHLPDWLGRYIK